MAAWGYEIFIRVLKNLSRVSAAIERNIYFFSTREEKFRISKGPHVMLYLLYKHQ